MTVQITGTLTEVGTTYYGKTNLSIQTTDSTAKEESIDIPCTEEEAKAMGKYLYQKVMISVTVANMSSDESLTG